MARAATIKPGSKTDAMVSWIDLLPTIIEEVGGQVPSGLDGKSFASILRGESNSHRRRIFATHSGDQMMNVYLSRSIRLDRYKLTWNPHPQFAFTTHIDLMLRPNSGDYFKQWIDMAQTDAQAAETVARYHGRPGFELFDLKVDPDELVNLAGKPESVELQNELLLELKSWIKDQGDKLTVFHEPLMLNAPETWVPRSIKKKNAQPETPRKNKAKRQRAEGGIRQQDDLQLSSMGIHPTLMTSERLR